MKKWMMVVSLMVGLGLALSGVRAQAAETGTIVVTVSLATETSVTLSPGTWAIGPISRGSTSAPQSFTAKVGNSATKLEIKGTDGAGGWTLGSSAGINSFAVSVTSPALNLSTTYQVLVASAAAYSSQAFELTYHAPAQDTQGGGIDQSFSITVKASVP